MRVPAFVRRGAGPSGGQLRRHRDGLSAHEHAERPGAPTLSVHPAIFACLPTTGLTSVLPCWLTTVSHWGCSFRASWFRSTPSTNSKLLLRKGVSRPPPSVSLTCGICHLSSHKRLLSHTPPSPVGLRRSPNMADCIDGTPGPACGTMLEVCSSPPHLSV